jgi:glucose/arabinose dehydrogenase
MKRSLMLLLIGAFCGCEADRVHPVAVEFHDLACEGGTAEDVCISYAAKDQGALRGIAFHPNGDLFGVLESGTVRRYRDADNNGTFEKVDDFASSFGRGGSIAVDDAGKYIYVGSPSGVLRIPVDAYAEAAGRYEMVVFGAPTDGPKGYVTVGLDGATLFLHVGPRANAVAPSSPDFDRTRAIVKRFDLTEFDPQIPFDWDEDGEVIAVGLSRTPAIKKGPDGKIYAIEHGMRGVRYRGFEVGKENPADVLVSLEDGSAHGYPYCFFARHMDGSRRLKPRSTTEIVSWPAVDPGTPLAAEVFDGGPGFSNPHDDSWCQEQTHMPSLVFDARSEPMDLVFLSQNTPVLPVRWSRGAIFAVHSAQTALVFHGVGGEDEVIWTSDRVTPWGIAISPKDGAIYVSSDDGMIKKTEASPPNGALYRLARR